MHRGNTQDSRGQGNTDVPGADSGDASRSDGAVEDFTLQPTDIQLGPGADITGEYHERGIAVFRVSDEEWWAGREKESVRNACLEEWGGEATDYWRDQEEEEEYFGLSNLDTNKVNLDEDMRADGKKVTYREYIRELIAGGQQFPCFFAGTDW